MNGRLKVLAVGIAALIMVSLTPIGGSATFPGDNGRIIFNRGSPSLEYLVSMAADGSDEKRLTQRQEIAFAPSWAPDGSRFIYTRVLRGGRADLFMRDADGSNRTRVTDTVRAELFAAFGPDGNHAVFERCRFNCDLFIVNLTTGAEKRLTDSRADETTPDWSVDDVIVFERNPRRGGDTEIFTINSDGSNRSRLTNNNRVNDLLPSWSPDGTRIVYSRCSRSGCDLFTMDAVGSGRNRVTNSRADEFGAKFSPDDQFFVVTRVRGAVQDLFRMRTDGHGVRRLTDTPNRFDVDADWQPII